MSGRVAADEQCADACRLADLISILLKTSSDMHLPAIRRGVMQGNGAENPLCSVLLFKQRG